MNVEMEMEPPVRESSKAIDLPLQETLSSVSRFIQWLDGYGELSYDFQTYYSGALGRKAKQLYYTHRKLGTVAVLPMVLSEAFFPWGRRLFWKPQRIPIADAHYAMGFAVSFRRCLTTIVITTRRSVHFPASVEANALSWIRGILLGVPFSLGDDDRNDP
jgi:hypothetical protein